MTYVEFEPNHPPQQLASFERSELLKVTEHESGAQIERLRVYDDYAEYGGREVVQQAVAQMDEALVDNPDWLAPTLSRDMQSIIMNNPASTALYQNSHTLQEWFVDAAQAHATALYPLQRPDTPYLPSGEAVDGVARSFFYHGLDAIGIRSRAKIMSEVVQGHVNGEAPTRWVSLACGAAVPVVEALHSASAIQPIHIDLIDMNEQALEFASDLLIDECGLDEVSKVDTTSVGARSFSRKTENLIRGLISSDSLVTELGEGQSDVVDALGIFEYFSEKVSAQFLRNAHRLLSDDGVLVIANMLSDRPQMDFNKRAVGWPKLYPRSIDEMTAIIQDAGINPTKSRILIPEDGIYAVVEITK